MKFQSAYNELLRRSRESAMLTSCISLLGWDELTYMPPAGAENRGHQMAYLGGLQHAQACDLRIGELLAEVERACAAVRESPPRARAAGRVDCPVAAAGAGRPAPAGLSTRPAAGLWRGARRGYRLRL